MDDFTSTELRQQSRPLMWVCSVAETGTLVVSVLCALMRLLFARVKLASSETLTNAGNNNHKNPGKTKTDQANQSKLTYSENSKQVEKTKHTKTEKGPKEQSN